MFINNKPFLIAEISANHCGNYNIAKKLIKTAKDNKADAVKLQTFEADTITLNSNKKFFKIQGTIWHGYNLWKLYDEAHTPKIWHKKLFDYAKKIKIKIFSTAYDDTAVDFLEKLKCPAYKIASFEMTDVNLLEKIAKTKKPMIISTGMANLNEIDRAVFTVRKFGCRDLTLLYCVSKYPSDVKDFNMNNINILKQRYKCRIGFSDHSKDNRVAIAAVAAGAEVVEKHIALENQKKGLDIKFSIKGKEIKKFKEDITFSYNLSSHSKFFRTKEELKNKVFRRSVFAVSDIKKGEKLTTKNIKRIRPGHGLDPYYYKKILGKKTPFHISKGDPLNNKLLKILKIKKINS